MTKKNKMPPGFAVEMTKDVGALATTYENGWTIWIKWGSNSNGDKRIEFVTPDGDKIDGDVKCPSSDAIAAIMYIVSTLDTDQDFPWFQIDTLNHFTSNKEH
tara:strand:+ start:791 stop:1096 length:306 start_codon:yes stop_codon:yes gene_type:complete